MQHVCYCPRRCSVPQPWEPVPAGYVVGGLVTCSKPEGRPQDTWVHQLAYVFVGALLRAQSGVLSS